MKVQGQRVRDPSTSRVTVFPCIIIPLLLNYIKSEGQAGQLKYVILGLKYMEGHCKSEASLGYIALKSLLFSSVKKNNVLCFPLKIPTDF